MIPDLLVLAKATKVATTHAAERWPLLPAHIPVQGDFISWCQHMGPAVASLLVVAGVIYLAFGVYFYRALVTLNAAAVGTYIGGLLGAQMGNTLAGAMVGGCVAAAIVWPGMKYAVATMGGLLGALLGASIWRSIGLEPAYVVAGALIGMIFFGMLSFIVFRGSIMMYLSLQGAVMLVFGILGMMYKYHGLDATLTHNLSLKPFILPLCIFVSAVAGLIYQQTQYPTAASSSSSSSSGSKK